MGAIRPTRSLVAVIPHGDRGRFVLAFCDDGTAWRYNPYLGQDGEWQAFPAVPGTTVEGQQLDWPYWRSGAVEELTRGRAPATMPGSS